MSTTGSGEGLLPHVLLIVLLAAYTVLGALVFLSLESPHEVAHKEGLHEAEQRLANALWTRLSTTGKPVDELQFRALLASQLRLYEQEARSAYAAGVKTDSSVRVWTFWGSMYYASTVYTTIGYGNFTPATLWARVATVIYGLIGIPLFLVVLADVGKLMTRALKRVLSSAEPAGDQFDFSPIVAVLIAAAYTAAGAALFALWEGWSFPDAFYFVFITLSTVGFGDLVPDTAERFAASFVYILGGLAVLAMVFTVITDALTLAIRRLTDGLSSSSHVKTT